MPSNDRSWRRAGVAAALFVASGATFAQTPAAETLRLRTLAATCASCHGTDGRAVQGEAMVTLAGQSAATMAAQMKAFRDGTRTATIMHQIAKGYTDQQIDAIAAYYAAIR